MKKATHLAILSVLFVVLVLVSCTNPVKKDIFVNVSLTGEAENISDSRLSTTPASFKDNIVVNKYKVYLYQDGATVYQQELTSISNNTISLHFTDLNSGTYTLRVEAFKDTTPIFYGEKVVQLTYGQNDVEIATYFNKAKLTVSVQNQAEGFELSELKIEGTLPASPTNQFVESKSFENKEIYPGVWDIDVEATLTRSGSAFKVTYPVQALEIYPSEEKVLNFVIKRDDLGNVYIDMVTQIELPYLDEVWNMRAERDEDGLKIMWDYDLPATFNVYKGTGNPGDIIELIGSTTQKYFVDPNPVDSKNHYYINAMYGGKESGLCEIVVDLETPKIKILSPRDGVTVAGTVTITAEAEDNDAVAKVEFYIDGTKVGEDTNAPYQYYWNTVGITNDSTHTIQARAYDALGNMGQSNMITIIVRNGPPQVTIVNPTDGETLQGTVTIVAEAYDDEGINQVEFFINDELLNGFVSAPYEYTWNTAHFVSDGTHTLKAKVTDLSGNYGFASINVTVNNGQKTFGGTDYDGAYAIQQTEDGGYIVAGYTWSFGAGGADVYVLKLDSAGNLEWQKTFGGSSDDFAYSIQQTADGGYIVAGYTLSFGAGVNDAYVLKLDSAGNLEWQKTFGGSSDDFAYSIQQTSDGGYIVAGNTWSFGAGGADAYVLKLDSAGNLEWQKTFGGSGHDYAYSIQQTTDDGYIVAGYTNSFGAGDDDAYVLKLDSAGTLQWQKVFGGSSDDFAYSIQQTSDGGYIVAGYTWSFGAGSRDVYVLKLDSAGNLEWQKTFGRSNYHGDVAYSIQQTTDDGYIVAGDTYSYGAGSRDAYILKLDSAGTLQWQKVFGGSSDDFAYSIQQTSDGGYIVAGYTWSFGAGSRDVYVLKLDSNGDLHPFQ